MPTGKAVVIEKCNNCRYWQALNHDRERGECSLQRSDGRTEFETPTGEFIVTYIETRTETLPQALCPRHAFTDEAAHLAAGIAKAGGVK